MKNNVVEISFDYPKIKKSEFFLLVSIFDAALEDGLDVTRVKELRDKLLKRFHPLLEDDFPMTGFPYHIKNKNNKENNKLSEQNVIAAFVRVAKLAISTVGDSCKDDLILMGQTAGMRQDELQHYVPELFAAEGFSDPEVYENPESPNGEGGEEEVAEEKEEPSLEEEINKEKENK